MSKVMGILGIATAVLGGVAAVLEAIVKSRDGDGDCESADYFGGSENYPFWNDEIEWYCDCCGAHMNEQSGFSTITEMWLCTKCGYANDVSENNIVRENEYPSVKPAEAKSDVLRKNRKEYRGYIPSGCKACGGPYPDCMTACKIFDD